ncbi:hypothetical protein DRN72_02675 [Methanosarcinales archaeon]|jgi:NAD kinase|nr:MAG: hypothetical protein DRN72_02675 [Methanosarcinales archaeon]
MESTIAVELLINKEALVVVDGQYAKSIRMGERLVVTKYDVPARFVKIGENAFYEKVKRLR